MYDKRRIITKSQIEEYKRLLVSSELTYEKCEYTIGLYDHDKLIGSCSIEENCIKFLVVNCKYQGQGLTNALISDIITYASNKGIFDLFVYTKPMREFEFNKLGFKTIIKTSNVLFLENKKNGITKYKKDLSELKIEGKNIGSIVMNLNPFTKGHRYLIELACKECHHVHIFIVKEDKSVFPYLTRLKMLNACTSDLNNITIHEGSDYLISQATFPTYFIKSKEMVNSIYGDLDAMIFNKHIVSTLGITRRYIGTEPYSLTTRGYNESLKNNLDIEVIEVDRLKVDNEIVSASKFREYVRENKLEEAYNLLPIKTIEFLKTQEGKIVMENVKNSNSRH